MSLVQLSLCGFDFGSTCMNCTEFIFTFTILNLISKKDVTSLFNISKL